MRLPDSTAYKTRTSSAASRRCSASSMACLKSPPALPCTLSRSDEAVHHGIDRYAVQQEPVPQYALADGAGGLGHALAPPVPDRADDLEADEVRGSEHELRRQANGGAGHASAGRGAPDPVPE